MWDSKVTIKRFESGEQGTFGRLSFNNFVCFTLELPWNDNKPNISSIPSGIYKCYWTDSPKFKRKMYEVSDVPKRSGIRIHLANLAGDDTKGYKRQLNGCIALGFKLGTIDKQKAILLSKPAIRQFEDLMKEQSFILEII